MISTWMMRCSEVWGAIVAIAFMYFIYKMMQEL